MKNIFLLGALLFASVYTVGQSQNNWCGTDSYMEQMLNENPELREEYKRISKMGSETHIPNISSRSIRSSGPAQYKVPVVVHVVHDNCLGNISLDQIQDGIDVLNEDFRRLNADTNATRSVFQNVAADVEVEFELAHLDPNGNCTDGVVRINDPSNTYGANNNVKDVSYWPADSYLNIWIVNSVRNSGGGGIVLGYAQFPGGNWNNYGIVMRHDRIGRVGTSVSDGRTLTHEVGHCFNLYHTFQSGCGGNCSNSGDRVCDTPPSANSTFGCNTGQNTCSNDTQGPSSFTTDVVDQIENYMSYDDCQNMFSLGQKARMISVLNNIPVLQSLTSQANLVSTGLVNFSESVCKADFEINITGTQPSGAVCETGKPLIACVGDTVSFFDRSFFNPQNFDWSFEGAQPMVSNNANPKVVYTEPGTYDVELTVFDSLDSASIVKSNVVKILPRVGENVPFVESFEFSEPAIDKGWILDDFSQQFGWEVSGFDSYTGTQSLKLNNFFSSGAGEATAESPVYSLENMDTAFLTFKSAFAQRDGSFDILRVEVSTNCGRSWSFIESLVGPILASTDPINAPLNNLTDDDWADNSIAIPSQYLSPNFRFRFRFQSNGGNDLYIDDINIEGTLNDSVILISPKLADTDVSTSPELNWAAARGDQYEIEIDRVPSFNSGWLQSYSQPVGLGLSTSPDTRRQLNNLDSATTYYWRVRVVENGTSGPWSETWRFTTAPGGDATSISDNQQDTEISMYPNPANSRVVISGIDNPGSIRVYNSVGVNVINKVANSGSDQYLNTSRLAEGVYYVRIKTNNTTVTKRLVIAR